ncbi:MAG: antibiotic biosynthesis monooxygenase [Rhodospirillales bacterium]|nr:antibiotic biosynthesis monooxygenase [Rhodospirillales bacterium]
MFAVIFEAEPAPGRHDAYLAQAAALAPLLAETDGFIENRRFRRADGGSWLLSLSFWRDEAALSTWRTQPRHRGAQAAGRGGIFRQYRLRVGRVLEARETAPGAALVLDDPQAPSVSLPTWPAIAGLAGQQRYLALADPAIPLHLASFTAQLPGPAPHRHRIAVLRDYTLTDRAEAPADSLAAHATAAESAP